MLDEIRNKMEELSADESAMFIEHEFADNLLEIISSNLSDDEKLDEIRNYAQNEYDNTEYEIIFDWAKDILNLLGVETEEV